MHERTLGVRAAGRAMVLAAALDELVANLAVAHVAPALGCGAHVRAGGAAAVALAAAAVVLGVRSASIWRSPPSVPT